MQNEGVFVLSMWAVYMTKMIRRAFLEQQYHFHCTCPVCSLPEALSATSDRRLIRFAELKKQLSMWGELTGNGKRYAMTGPEAIKIIREMWKLLVQEKYMSERGQLAAMLVKNIGRVAHVWLGLDHGGGVDVVVVVVDVALLGGRLGIDAWALAERVVGGAGDGGSSHGGRLGGGSFLFGRGITLVVLARWGGRGRRGRRVSHVPGHHVTNARATHPCKSINVVEDLYRRGGRRYFEGFFRTVKRGIQLTGNIIY